MDIFFKQAQSTGMTDNIFVECMTNNLHFKYIDLFVT